MFFLYNFHPKKKNPLYTASFCFTSNYDPKWLFLHSYTTVFTRKAARKVMMKTHVLQLINKTFCWKYPFLLIFHIHFSMPHAIFFLFFLSIDGIRAYTHIHIYNHIRPSTHLPLLFKK